ncbi:LCP family protein [Nakamurella aerolata]|uniref:LCP family protein n=1 Tax=Nakamurella aerolata TaxID=1656892 RepID=A0A849A652_9ACTN|nr:LCP family protein [Nakamurella aerolata]NNG34883.1 LCP family protein [Nakamurella aerolata]
MSESGSPGRSSGRRAAVVTLRSVLAVVAVAVLAVVGVSWGFKHHAENELAARQVDALVPDDPNIRPADGGPAAGNGAGGAAGAGSGAGAENGTGTEPSAGRPAGGATLPPLNSAAGTAPENILVLGVDTRGDATNGVGEGTSQSDVIMLVHLHAGHRKASVLSIPRDTYVAAPQCHNWDNATGKVSNQIFRSAATQWKITNAYAVGGPRCSVQAVQALTGLRVDRLITFQFDGFGAIVNSLGGLRMSFPGPVIDKNQGTVIAKAGVQQIDGATALKLARSRIVQGDPTGDLGRVKRQQQLIAAMMRQLSSSGMLSDPARLNRTVDTFIQNSTTANVSVDGLLDLARQLGGGASSVSFSTIPTTPSTSSDGLNAAPGAADMFAKLRNDQTLG